MGIVAFAFAIMLHFSVFGWKLFKEAASMSDAISQRTAEPER
jgi:Flp pilus assembly protein TadG